MLDFSFEWRYKRPILASSLQTRTRGRGSIKITRVNHILVILTVCFQISIVYAQKQNATWAFGYKCGIDFNDSSTVKIFPIKTYGFENSACISNGSGKLILYLGDSSPGTYKRSIINKEHLIVEGGLNVNTHISFAGSVLFLPNPNDSAVYYFFNLGENSGCPWSCLSLYYSSIDMNENNGDGKVTIKDRLLLNGPFKEGVAAVKHANGKDWWLIAHEQNQDSLCSNKFYKILIGSFGILGPFTQEIGTMNCAGVYLHGHGEIKFSQDGNHMVFTNIEDKIIDLYDFNRCTGNLFNYRQVDNNILSDYAPYSSEFSNNGKVLYISSNMGYGAITNLEDRIYQYDLTASDISSTRTKIYGDSTHYYVFGQLQIAPNGKIYVAYGSPWSGIDSLNFYNQNLCVVTQPDSLGLACDFQPFSFFLGDSSASMGDMPNIPNYGLGPLSIYKADAGEDKTICVEDTTVKGVILGDSSVAGVAYSWYPTDSLNDPSIAMPFANPSQTTMYIVTLTDTSIKYSCQSRQDTVWVFVKDCSVGIPQYSSQHAVVRVYPNPGNEILNIELELLNQNTSIQQVELFDVSGKLLKQTNPNAQHTSLSTQHLTQGLYFCRVTLSDGESVVRKVMIGK